MPEQVRQAPSNFFLPLGKTFCFFVHFPNALNYPSEFLILRGQNSADEIATLRLHPQAQ